MLVLVGDVFVSLLMYVHVVLVVLSVGEDGVGVGDVTVHVC